MASVVLRNVRKIYPFAAGEGRKRRRTKSDGEQGVVAVHQFDLEIADREFIVLVGPSGCGKSTTLRMVAGLEEISEGDLLIDGKRVNDLPPKDRDIAMVFQSYALYPDKTVYDNMAFSLKLRGAPKEEIDRRVREAADILDITRYLNRKPKALSGGQRQRVAIGRAIVRKPKVFLMDEPLSNLDAKLRNQMRTEIIQLRKRIDTTFLYVTHDQTEAMTLGDRIVVMRDGYIQQIGTPQEVFHNPYNLFVAGFIGSPQMNFFDAELELQGGRYAVAVGSNRVEVSQEKQENLKRLGVQPQPITLGVRPEHLCLAASGIPARVEVSELMGSSIHLHVTVSDRDTVLVIPTMELSGAPRVRYAAGDIVMLTFPGSAAHLFGKDSGINLEAEPRALPN